MNTLDLASKKVNLKKVASTHGGEWHGPCPGCGGTDRFHVWPENNKGKGGFWCRACGKTGDNIQFLIEFDGMDFKAACQYLNLNMDDYKTRRQDPPPKKEFEPVDHKSPDELWQERAEKFLSWSEGQLHKNQDVMAWLAARGINTAAVKRARLGWNPGENGNDIFRPRPSWGLPALKKEDGRARMLWLPRGLVIPYVIGGVIQRLRIRRNEGEPRYYVVPGSSMSIMIIGADRRAFVTVESELDAIACAAATDLAGAVAMGSSHAKPDAGAYTILKNSLQILNALDYDKAGADAYAWWKNTFGVKCDRWPVPVGKDPGEAYAMGKDLGAWIKAGLPPLFTMDVKAEIARDKKIIEESAGPQAPAISPLISELYKLLKNNPGVKIINTPERYTVLKNDRYVGGRINELVMREQEIIDYIIAHPDAEITHANLIAPENKAV